MYNLIVIGGGPAGYMAAERAGKAGLSVLLIEKRALGGVCLNEGCIPSKTLLHSAKIFDYALHGEVYGVNTQNASLDHKLVIARKNKVVDTLVGGVKAQLKASKVTVVYGQAYILDNNRVQVDDKTYTGERLLIAVGSIPVIPPIGGLDEGLKSGFVVTSREILDLEEIPKNLAIIGGGVIGLEMASYYSSAGSKVTVIEMLPKIGGPLDNELSTVLLENLRKKGIEFKLGARVTGVTDNSVEFDCMQSAGGQNADGQAEGGQTEGGQSAMEQTADGQITTGQNLRGQTTASRQEVCSRIASDKVLLSIGRKPAVQGFGLENTDVSLDRGAIITDHHGLTSVPNIYAAGDVNGKYMLAHAAYREAEVAVNHMLGKRDIMRYDAVPSVIYTSPEAASVGETEETGREKGIDCISARVPMAYSGRYVAENSVTDGICKVVADRKHGNIIGVHMIGSYCSEIILSACTMIEMQMRVDDVKEIVFPHPTVSEIIREAVFKL